MTSHVNTGNSVFTVGVVMRKIYTNCTLCWCIFCRHLLHVITMKACCVVVACLCTVVQSTNTYPFRNVSLPWELRVDDLVKRLSLGEIVGQLTFGGGGIAKPTPPITRLGIPSYNFYTECMHGVGHVPSTVFPQTLGLAATFRYGGRQFECACSW